MLKNATYNLMETGAVLSKGLHRYETFMKDAQGCQHCQQIWTQMKQMDEQQLQRILPHLMEHMQHEQAAKVEAGAKRVA